MAEGLPHRHLTVVGVLTVVAFGSWFYGYGVLLEPIRQDTGWSESALSGVYGASLLVTGVGGTIGGRLLDRRGSRPLFLATGLIGVGGLLAASAAGSAWWFAVAGTLGGGAVGAGGYYNATQSVAARLAPGKRTRAITAITLWGAFASPVFLPLMGWLTAELGWRPALRVVALAVGVAFAAAVALVPNVRAPSGTTGGLRHALGTAVLDPTHRRLFAAGMVAGVSTSLLLLYQVPAMTGAGLALTTASTLAGARGLAQLAGRIPLPAVVDRVGAGSALRWSYVLTGAGGVLLLASSTVTVGLAYVAVAGVGIGALSALEGIYAAEVVDDAVLGTNLGLYALLRGVGAAAGPIIGGLTIELTGSRTVALVLAAAAGVVAAVLLPVSSARGAAAASGDPPPSSRPAGT